MYAPRIAIAGGGTGGHIAPAIALAHEITQRFGPDAAHVISGNNPIERGMLGHSGLRFTAVSVSRPRGTLRSKATTVLSSAMAVPSVRRLLRELEVDAMICVGGYASLPGAMAAALLRIPVFLLESNAVPGRVTRTLARMARACFAHMPLSRELDCPVHEFGSPVRREYLEPVDKATARRALGMYQDTPTLLVMGGSQGAKALNRSFIQAAAALESLAGSIQVLHLTGHADVEKVRAAWRASGVHHRVSAFTNNTATWFAAADLAVSRAGAGTISELLALGVPMILAPYPFAADDHQRANAAWVAGAGAAVVVDDQNLGPVRIRELIDSLLLTPSAHKVAAAAAGALAKPNAACAIIDHILEEIDASYAPLFADQSQRAAA